MVTSGTRKAGLVLTGGRRYQSVGRPGASGPVSVRSRRTRGRPLACLAAVSLIALVVASTAAAAVAPANWRAPRRLALVTVSNPRPELVSGGEALVRVEVGSDVNPADVRITADGHDVTSSFHAQSDGSLLGLVTGLVIGRNRLVAYAGRWSAASLDVIDHSINGPVFSGKQQLPFLCQTTAFGLAASSPPDCFAPRWCRTRIRTPPERSCRWPIRLPFRLTRRWRA